MRPLVLASKSVTRRTMLEAAGLSVEIQAPQVDERALEAGWGPTSPGEVARRLAEAKALAVALDRPDRVVVGADQTLALGEKRFSKPADRAAARVQLLAMRGATHHLHSAVALAIHGRIVDSVVSTANLSMRSFSDATLDAYLDAVGDDVTASVGAYRVEGPAIQLFETIEGDWFTVLGLPLLPLLGMLRSHGVLPQ